MALAKKFRLRSSLRIDLTYKKGVFTKSPFFRIQYRKTHTPLSFAFVVSKKIDARAVIRNGLKRRVSAVFADIKTQWQSESGDMVVSIFEASKIASYAELFLAAQKTMASVLHISQKSKS